MMKDENKLLIMKFGGTSVGSRSAIRQTAQIIQRYTASARLVVVV
jgi:aspartokinase